MLVPNLAEEVDSVLAGKERCRNRVYRCVSPALDKIVSWVGLELMSMYLVVEAATAIEVVEKGSVSLATPKVHIGNLKVAPDFFCWGCVSHMG
jgi:hypothetical protein